MHPTTNSECTCDIFDEKRTMKYQIRSLGYDPEADELDLLTNADAPQSAEAIPVDDGVYIRRAFQSGAIVGAFIRGYEQFALKVAQNQELATVLAKQHDFEQVLVAIIEWQREVGALSHQLVAHLEVWPPQDSFLQILVKSG